MSADISGFTALSERLADRGRAGAEEVVAVVNGCFEEMIAAAVRYGGDILKFGGDALLILFDGDEHATRAAVACAEIRRVVDQPRIAPSAGPIDLSMSVGLHTGTFDLFLGRGRFSELIIAGPDATETIACESAADAGQVLASADTVEELGGRWIVGDVRADGRAELSPPVDRTDLAIGFEQPPTEHLAALVPRTLLDHLDQGGLQGEVRPVTTAFIGFSGIDDAIRRQGPRRVARTLESLVEVVSQACESFNVHWLDTDIAADGGKIHLTAGAPTATPDDDGAMLHAVRAILDTCPDPPLAAGINHGNVFVGDVGSPVRRTLSAMGDSVNLAARLCGKADPGQIVATVEVLEGSATPFDAEPLDPFHVKGKSQPILAGIVGHPIEPSQDDVGPSSVPFMARDEELARLRAALDRAKEGQPQVVLLRGPGGIGKTRLAHELQRVESEVRVLSATCDPYQQSTPFVPFRDLLRRLVDIGADDTPQAAGERLSAFVEHGAPTLRPWTPLLALPLGATVTPTPEADKIAPAFRRIRLQQAMTDFLRETLTEPTILVVEDVEWLDNASRDLLSDLMLGMFDRPWCLVLTGTSVDGADTDADILQLDLPGLPDDAMRRLAIHALGEHPLHPHDLDRLVDTAAGHALFLLELVAEVRAGESVDALPRTIEAAVTSRLDALPPADLALLRQAAVVGNDMRLDVLAAVLGPEAGDPDRWAGMGAFVAVEEGRLRFVEPLYQQVAYDGIAFALRADLHGRAADVLAGADVGDLTTLANLARHAEGSGRHELAWEANVRAGDAMRHAWAIVDAVEHYERALQSADHLPQLPPDEIADVAERLGDVAEIASLHSEAVTAYERAREATSGTVPAARLERKIAESLRNTGDFDAAEEQLHRGLRRLEGIDDDPSAGLERSKLMIELARLRFRQGRFADVAALVSDAEAEITGRDVPNEVLGQLAFVRASGLMQVNDPGAEDGLRTALEHYDATTDLIGRGHCHTNLGIVAYYAGDWDQALDHYRRAQRLYADAGYVLGSALCAFNFGEICAQQQKHAEAVTWFEEARRRYRATHNKLGMAATESYLAWARARVGDPGESEALARQAVTTLDELGAEDHASSARIHLAEMLADGGRGDEAEAILDEVLDASPPAPIVTSAWRAKGAALRTQARDDEARTAFALACRMAHDEDLPYEAALAALALAELGGSTQEQTTAELAASSRETLDRLGVQAPEDPAVMRAVEGAVADRLRGRLDRAQERLAASGAARRDDPEEQDGPRHLVDLEDLTVEYRRGHYADVLRRLDELAPDLARAGAEAVARATLLRASAATHLHRPEAREALADAIGQFTALRDDRGAGMAHANLAALHLWEGAWDDALTELAEATRLYQAAGEERLATVQRVNEAEILMARGDAETARGLLEQAIEVYERLTYPLGMAYAMIGLGMVHLEEDPFTAGEHLEQAVSMLEEIGAEDMLAKARATLASALLDQGDAERPAELLEQVLASTDDPEARALALRVRGALAADAGDADGAADDLRAAAEVAHAARLELDEAKALLALSKVRGLERDERVAAGRKAREVFGRLGVVMTRP